MNKIKRKIKIWKKLEVVSFDNLALSQLDVKRFFSDKYWESIYMGNDGQYTMYIDLVKEEFAKSSTSINRFALMDNIVDMFNVVREKR